MQYSFFLEKRLNYIDDKSIHFRKTILGQTLFTVIIILFVVFRNSNSTLTKVMSTVENGITCRTIMRKKVFTSKKKRHWSAVWSTKTYTQTLECLWSISKLKILRKIYGTTPEMLHQHSIEAWNRSINEKDQLFTTFLNDTKKVYCE